MASSKPSAGVPFATQQGPYAGARNAEPVQPSGVPVGDLYATGLRDYNAAKNAIAAEEFNQVIQTSPNDNLAGNAWFYLGEMDFHAGKFPAALKDYDHVLNEYPGNNKAAVARLHKANALLALKDRESAIIEFRAVIQRFPNTPEATSARTKLSALGVPSAARR